MPANSKTTRVAFSLEAAASNLITELQLWAMAVLAHSSTGRSGTAGDNPGVRRDISASFVAKVSVA